MRAGLAGLEEANFDLVSLSAGRGRGRGRRKVLRQVKIGGVLLCQLVVGEWIGVGSLPVEFLLGQLGVAFFFVEFAVVFALLALACCCHCGRGCGFVGGNGEEVTRLFDSGRMRMRTLTFGQGNGCDASEI